MTVAWIIAGLLFGLILGSASTALIPRLVRGQSLSGRSRCDHCGEVIGPRDLVPLISFVLLRGRCRICDGVIPRAYLWNEAAAGMLGMALFGMHQPQSFDSILFARDVVAVIFLFLIFVADTRFQIIPDVLSVPLFCFGVLLYLLRYGFQMNLIIGIVVGFGVFGIQYFVSKGRWIGAGDMRLGAAMGALMGWPLVGIALMVSYVLGAVVGLMLLLTRRIKMEATLPMGSFLVIGTLITLWWGDQILLWYIGRF